jgi:hypothetical protein
MGNYRPSTLGLTANSAAGYDTGMLLFFALNRTLSMGYDPYNRSAILDGIEATSFMGTTGKVQLAVTGEFAGEMVEIRQHIPGKSVTVLLANVDMETGNIIDFRPTSWIGNLTQPPPEYKPDSCGLLMFRSLDNRTCIDCPPNTMNPSTDGEEICMPCELGTTLVGDSCEACGSTERGQYVDGVARCTAKPKQISLRIIGYIVGPICVLLVVYFIFSKFRRIRTKVRYAEKRADQEKKFVSFVFHEVRNPLNGLVGSLEFVEEEVKRLARLRMGHLRAVGASSSISPAFSALADEKILEPPIFPLDETRPAFRKSDTDSTPRVRFGPDDTTEDFKYFKDCLEDLNNCKACTRHALNVLNTVLDLSKIMANKFTMGRDPVEVVALVSDLAKVIFIFRVNGFFVLFFLLENILI